MSTQHNTLALTELHNSKNYVVGSVERTAGENLSAYEVVYMKSDGKLWKADASAITTAPVIAMATEAITADNTGAFLFFGEITNGSWSWTVGAPVYLSETAGALTETAPSTANAVVQRVGIALAATVLMFKPSIEYTEV